MCTGVNTAKCNRMLSSLTESFSAMCRRSRGTTPEQLQRNIAMADAFFKQQHAMQRARAAGEDPYTAIEQHFGMPPTILNYDARGARVASRKGRGL